MASGLGRIAVIVNPVAGGGRGLRLLPRVLASLHEIGDVRRVHVTAAPGEATEVAAAAAADDLDAVLAVGGDGTVNEVANGLVDAAGSVPLGVVAAGRGADFVRSLGLPRNAD
ncbi:MAG: acylglycerol kinase family protein, partial [Chloroflexota bacterium]|nr:acylglycerol kinase family protein [Chloroflexota bacterium]